MPYKAELKKLQYDHLFGHVDINTSQIDVPDDMFNGWQKTLDLLAEIVDSPAVLIMKVTATDISVFTTSNTQGNPYNRHDSEVLGNGLYCETVIKNQSELHIPNALKDPEWDQNPDIKLGMIAYCGLPLTWPNKTPFGTICMLDNQEREYSQSYRQLLERFQNGINANLAHLYQQSELQYLNQILENNVQKRTTELAKLSEKLIKEIEERRVIEDSVDYYKSYDALTGLPNRLSFISSLTQQLNASIPANTTVIYFGLRNFKSINNSYGYVVGDKLLQLFTQRVQSFLSSDTLFARVAGAEFVIAQPKCDSTDEIQLINQIITSSNTPFTIAEFTITIPCCMGIAQAPSDSENAAELIQKAGAAMDISKVNGSPYTFFTKQTQLNIEQRYHLESNLVDALKNGELSLNYQPFFCLKNNKVIGAEALLRWNNPILGNVPPDQFINLAERNGQINEIGNFVLHTAIAQAAKWFVIQPQNFRIAINISPVQFRNSSFAEHIENLLSLYNLPASALEIEITEGILLQDEHVAQHTIKKLQQFGVRVSLDDFGTGYSSLSYLQKYSFNTLKIDRCFITNIEKNEQDRELSKAIIAIGKKLDMHVIAEGVETQAQDDFIKSEECDYGQGYLYGKPVTADLFEKSYFS
ncbi:EAL domain-containing protein [Vibrio gallaecicus]|uniref:sensor domain-containing phosphodiesterase n=1 Tax=Vibrio gallaecicus TaxID=552386 RepID=UPI0010C963FB|nr:sensor domain-containing phosphodiesterase [Vibrio gallaecicus]MDN3613270.1 sensor domain-containing phosphodiesterase [Vibrio gallaecicus]